MQPSCPKCGSLGTGRFCAHCGSPQTGSGGSGGLATRERRAWWAAGLGLVLMAVVLILLLRSQPASPPPPQLEAGGAAPAGPPDLSTMSPRERFDRLYKRVMGAAEGGDTATVTQFAPMVFAAYGMLDTVDADARYHAAILHLHVRSDTAAALRLADSILASSRHHLLGYLIRGMAARLAGDDRLLARAQADFRDAWDSEMKAGRAEYRDHQAMLDQFHAGALAAK